MLAVSCLLSHLITKQVFAFSLILVIIIIQPDSIILYAVVVDI